jgi:hypothetical protein
MSINDAVSNLITASNQLSAAAIPVLNSWLHAQSGGAVSRLCPDELTAWLSNLHPERVRAEHDWTLTQVNYLARLLPGITPKE